MVEKKNQHFIPKSYLAAWCDADVPEGFEPWVHLFLRDGTGHRRKAPHNIFAMPDLYTGLGPEGQRDLTIENAFSTMEGRFVSVRDRLLAGEDLNETDLSTLFIFVGAMMARVPPSITHMRKFWERVHTIASEVRISPGSKPIQTLSSGGPTMSLSDVAETVRNPMGTWFPESVKGHVNGLSRFFGLTILHNETDIPFVTSDKPAVMFDAHHQNRTTIFRGGLSDPAMEVSLPASPNMAFIFQHAPRMLLGYRCADADDVMDINMRTILFADERFVSNREDISFVKTITDTIRYKGLPKP